MKHTESNLQKSCIAWFDAQYGKLYNREVVKKTKADNGTYSFKSQKVSLLFAIPNGADVSPLQRKIMSGQGVRPGVSDLFLSVPSGVYHGLYMELKTDKGRESEAQKAFSELVKSMGYRHEVIRSVEQFIETVTNYLKS
jgi:hypothetical protein